MVIFLTGCSSNNKIITDKKTGNPILVGLTELSAFENPNFSEWYSTEYSAYEIDEFILEQIKIVSDSINIEIYMGTWCGDSRREVPRFIRILDSVDFDMNNLMIVNLDRNKTSPGKLEKDKNIEYVPTFIIYRNNVELGRIIEFPIITLESDLLDILMQAEVEL